MINPDRLVKTFCDLVSIDSPSSSEEKMRSPSMLGLTPCPGSTVSMWADSITGFSLLSLAMTFP